MNGLFAQFNLLIVVLIEFSRADIFNFYISYIHSWVIMILRHYKGLELKIVMLGISEHRMFKCRQALSRNHLHLILYLYVPLFCLIVKRSILWRGWKNNEWNITVILQCLSTFKVCKVIRILLVFLMFNTLIAVIQLIENCGCYTWNTTWTLGIKRVVWIIGLIMQL